MNEYQVIEDNGGGMFLFFFDGDNVTLGIENIEHAHPGDLDNVTLAEARGWESQIGDPQIIYDDIVERDFGWEIVADQNGVYPDRMGRAAEIIFRRREK